MREYLGPKDIANTISMLKTAFNGTIVVVEGVTDRRLYGKFFEDDSVEVIVAHSKDNVRYSVKEVYENRGFEKIIGIVDTDLDALNNKKRKPPLFTTDTRDSESLMFRSHSLDDVLFEYSDEAALDRFVEEYGDIRDVVMDSCYIVGLLMYISDKEGLDLCFKDLNFDLFIDKRTLRCDTKKLIDEIVSNSFTRIGARTIRISLEHELRTERDPWIVCRGHDIVSVLSLGLRNIFGGYNCRCIRDGELAGALRLAFDEKDLQKTDLFKNSSKWCSDRGMTLWAPISTH